MNSVSAPKVRGLVASLAAVAMLCVGSSAWASSTAGSPASDGTGNSNAAPSHPHGVMDGAACGCTVNRAASAPSTAHAGASAPRATSHAGATSMRSMASHPATSRASSVAHFARASSRR